LVAMHSCKEGKTLTGHDFFVYGHRNIRDVRSSARAGGASIMVPDALIM